jgi:hypothetical protein
MNQEQISFARGDTYLNTLPIKDQNGLPYELTDVDIWLTVKPASDRAEDDSGAIFQLTLGDGIAIDDPSTGVLTIEITDERSNMLQAEKPYNYDVQIRKNSQTFTPVGGKVLVIRDVTRE